MSETLLFLGTHSDKSYLPRLKSLVGTASVFLLCEPISTITEVVMYCKKRNITGVISTNITLLEKLLYWDNSRKHASLSNYAGSYFMRDGIEFVFVDPLDQLVSVSYGAFLTRRYISKLSQPDSWKSATSFDFEIVTPANAGRIYSQYENAFAIAVDIETTKENLAIRCIGYTAIFLSGDVVSTHSCVLPIDSTFNLAWMRKFNELPAPKILQNGKYDCAYLARYNAPLYNYLWDTANLMHCTYSELPKDLAFLGAFYIRKAMYWKDLAQTSDLQEYYRYNALDTWNTANIFLAQMISLPNYARENYLKEFPLVFPCHLSEMTGIKRDMTELTLARSEVSQAISEKSNSLDKMLGVKGFNTNSPIQMKSVLKILGCSDLESADEKNLKKAALRHPLNSRVLNLVLDVRGERKLKSTYLRSDEDITKTSPGGAKELNGRILYSLNPHGTDTSRLASKEHHFWCGLQLQNIPRGKAVKRTIIADEGFRFAECDLEQAESRDTAYIAGDETLIAAVSGERDFHSVNASAFFGMPYTSIYCDSTHSTLDKTLRDLAKRVNHGANYLMGAAVLVDTMGEDKVWEAARLLKLPKHYTLKDIAEELLARFHRTYPFLSKIFYPAVVHEVVTTSKLQHHLVGETGWTRYCFGHPDKNKSDKNAYVAHVPQSLNAQSLNKAFLKVFYDIAINSIHSNNFKLCGQIHDSILFQFRIGHEYLMEMVRERMEIPVTIRGYDNKVRTFTVPAAMKSGKDGKGSLRWSETE